MVQNIPWSSNTPLQTFYATCNHANSIPLVNYQYNPANKIFHHTLYIHLQTITGPYRGTSSSNINIWQHNMPNNMEHIHLLQCLKIVEPNFILVISYTWPLFLYVWVTGNEKPPYTKLYRHIGYTLSYINNVFIGSWCYQHGIKDNLKQFFLLKC